MPSTFKQDIDQAILCLNELKKEKGLEFLAQSSKLLLDTFVNGGKVIIAGNGGSLCDAIHFAEELTGIFHRHRPALPAIALADPGHLTCIGNDIGFDEVFSRGVEAHGKEGDIFVALTTSGNSKNLVKAVERAKQLSLKTIAFLGRGGGKLKGQADLEWIVEAAPTTDRIQELHMTAIHLMIKEVEERLFGDLRQETISDAPSFALSL